jgi:AcrR family transcriptional regulator
LPSDTKKSQQILSRGIGVFAQKGFHAVNVEDLIAAAGVSRATFYAHYKNKEDLFTEIVDHILQEESSFVLKAQQNFLDSSSDFLTTIENIVSTLKVEASRSREAMILFFDVIPGSGTRAEQRFLKMQKVTLEHFTAMIRSYMETQGYSSSGALALAYLLIGGLSYIGRMIIYGEMKDEEVQEVLHGMTELLKSRQGDRE